MLTVKAGMTLMDGVIASAESLEDYFAFCALNGLGYSDDVQAGQTLQGTGLLYQINRPPTNDHITIKPVLVQFNQTLADMAIQQLGSLEDFFALAKLNNMAFSDDIASGQQLSYSLTPYNKAVLKIYQDNGYKAATGTTAPGQTVPVEYEGIGYWAIGFDFIVN